MNLSVPLAKDILPKLKQFHLHWINLKKNSGQGTATARKGFTLLQ